MRGMSNDESLFLIRDRPVSCMGKAGTRAGHPDVVMHLVRFALYSLLHKRYSQSVVFSRRTRSGRLWYTSRYMPTCEPASRPVGVVGVHEVEEHVRDLRALRLRRERT